MNPRRVSGTNTLSFGACFWFLSFQKPEVPVFDVLPLPDPLAPLDPLKCPFDFPLFSLLIPLPEIQDSLLDHDLLWLPLPDDCLLVFLLAMQSR